MNTFTGSYLTRFSSGTIAALLILSSFLFLVPFAPSVHAANASLPSVSGSPNVAEGGAGTPFSVTVSNPVSNAYSITAITVQAPSGWSFSYGASPAPCTGALGTLVATSSSAFTCSGNVPPGQTVTLGGGSALTLTPSSPTTVNALVGTFSTSVQDASSAAFYTGPTFKVYATGSSPSMAITFPSGDPCSSGTYTAGSGACSATATLTTLNGLGFVGVPVTFTTDPHSSASPTSGFTSSAGKVTTSWQPSNLVANSPSSLTATAGSAADTKNVNIAPGAISKATITLPGNTLSTAPNHYVTTSGPDALGNFGAKVAGGNILISLTDQFTNPVPFQTGDVVTVSASNGRFNTPSGSPTTTKTSVTCADFALGCPTSGNSFAIPNDYFQSATYGTIGTLSVTITRSSVTYPGLSGNIITSTFQSPPTPTPTFATGTPSSVYAGSTVMLHVTVSNSQPNVPVTFYLDSSSTQVNGDGHFTGGTQKVTVNTASNGTATVTFVTDTGAGATLFFAANVAQPVDGNPSHMLGNATSSSIGTVAGKPAKMVVLTYYDAPLTQPAKYAVDKPGTQLYVNVKLADKYNNPTTNTLGYQLQIQLTGPGSFSATNVYIAQGASDTKSSFGPILWTTPTTDGPATVTATSSLGVASKTVTIVKPTPNLFVNTANGKPVSSGAIFYVNSTVVVFSGNASASVGYPTSVSVDSVCWKLGTGASGCAPITPGNTVLFNAQIVLPVGLSTVQFNATDSEGNTAVSPTFKVLVDTSPPTIKFTTADGSTVSSGQAVQAVIVDTLGDLNFTSVSATYNGTAVPSSGIKVTGTNNLGVNTTYTVSISGLPSGKWVVQLSASDLAGNAATPVSITVVVVVPTNQSFTVVGTPSQTTVGGFPAVQVTYQNNLPAAQQGIVFAVVHNTKGQTVLISTATITPGAGAQATAFLVLAGLAPGTYSVDLLVLTSASVTISQTTTVTVTV